MRWERGEDRPVTWTTLDNAVVDDDLSCRALGLLTRWLRRPPGAEIDSIPDMVKRAKRAGQTNLEGRDALYAASYELETAGYLVRELVGAGRGQHEWVVRIYNRPVEPSRRSDPAERKRGTRKRSGAKPQVIPITGFQESADQEADSPDSAGPEPADQELSYKNSVNDSLSGTGRPTGDGSEQDERETARPEDNPAGDVDRVVSAYEAAAGRSVMPRTAARLRKDAAELLAAGRPVEWVAARAAEMPANGWLDLIAHCEVSRVPIPGQAGPVGVAGPGGGRGEPDEATRAAMAAILARGSGL
ncbi:hypothetical protein [Streptomyces sp. ADI98-10]|uniref:hypothetical protein n=1 Tax=Streptomyces sp. ADI98-10 TaxID=1522763 RepID=UPI000F558199|nr:hypothetical protein [Streptomyces sp. ADI98-10]